jgi:hypothetical protein
VYVFLIYFKKVPKEEMNKLQIVDLIKLEASLRKKKVDDVKKKIACSLSDVKWESIFNHYNPFDMEETLLGGTGMLFRDNYREILRKIDAIDPNALSSTLKDVMDPTRISRREGAAGCAWHKTIHEMKMDFEKQGVVTDDMKLKYERANEEIRRQEEDKETLILIDINIDGAQLFKNSSAPQAVPILGCIYSIGGYVVPLDQSKPFILGVSHGQGKAPVTAFMYHFLKDVYRLSIHRLEKGYDGRKLKVRIRCFICDSLMRYYIFGTCPHQGLYPCTRCHVRGEHDEEGKGMYYVDSDAEHRWDHLWKFYKDSEHPADEDKKGLRRHKCGVEGSELENRPISIAVTDPMHCLDGNAAADAIRWPLGHNDADARPKYLSTVRIIRCIFA